MGDGFDSSTALNLNSYRGKVLRMNLDGTAPTDNPFYNAADGINARDYVFAYGLRNPFGGAWRAADNTHYDVENGPNVDRFARSRPAATTAGTAATSRCATSLSTTGSRHTPRSTSRSCSRRPSAAAASRSRRCPTPSSRSRVRPTPPGPRRAASASASSARCRQATSPARRPQPLIEYTGNGKATANGIAAGPDGLYFTDLYKDINPASPIEPGAKLLRVRYGTPPPGHPRPKGASPFSVPLVPSFKECTAANRNHGPPLAYPSCGPPQQSSDYLTVGTPDANGRSAGSTGNLKLSTVVGNTGTTADEADVKVKFNMTDIRKRSDLSDYTGELRIAFDIQGTDTSNGPTLGDSATMSGVPLGYTLPCTGTASASIGSTCSLTTTADAVAPGTVLEGRRSVWELGPIRVRDGGSDGLISTLPNTTFARQGILVP